MDPTLKPRTSKLETSLVTDAQMLTSESLVLDSVPETVEDYPSITGILAEVMGLVGERIEQIPQDGMFELDKTITVQTSHEEEPDEQFDQSKSGEADNLTSQDDGTEHLSKDETVFKNDTLVPVFPTEKKSDDNSFIPKSSTTPPILPTLGNKNREEREGDNIFKNNLVDNLSDSPKEQKYTDMDTSDEGEFREEDHIDIHIDIEADQIKLVNNPRSLVLIPGAFMRLLRRVSIRHVSIDNKLMLPHPNVDKLEKPELDKLIESLNYLKYSVPQNQNMSFHKENIEWIIEKDAIHYVNGFSPDKLGNDIKTDFPTLVELDVEFLETAPIPLSLFMQTESELYRQSELEDEEIANLFPTDT